MPFEPHDVFEPPSSNARILRYMTFTKSVWLLDQRSLYFSRADLLGDRFEGSMSRANLRRGSDSSGGPQNRGPDIGTARQWFLRTVYVNCWTLSSYESVAMWRLYVGDGNGIAIQSTFRRMTESMALEPRSIFAGKVKYIDYDRAPIPENNMLYPFVRKRKSFDYEREVRALCSSVFAVPDSEQPVSELAVAEDQAPNPPGIAIPVDLSHLITTVRVSPVSPHWFTELVHSVLTRYDVRVRVTQSDIDGDPVY